MRGRVPERPALRSSVRYALSLSASLLVADLSAQDLEPRLYSSVPTGLNFLVVGYSNSAGSVLVDPSIALDDAKLTIDALLVGYARSVAVGPFLGKVDAGVARACATGSAEYRGTRIARDTCGLTDARLRLAVNFIGAPALTAEQFRGSSSDFVVGASLQLTAPTGDYDPSRLVNLGANRWSTKIEAGLSKKVRRWTLELALASTTYLDNDDFFGGSRREQEPLYSLQAHLVRTLPSGLWVAVDTTHYRGGQATVDATRNGDRQANSRLGFTVAIPANRNHSLKLYASRGIATRTGSDFDTIGLVWQYRWGAGL